MRYSVFSFPTIKTQCGTVRSAQQLPYLLARTTISRSLEPTI